MGSDFVVLFLIAFFSVTLICFLYLLFKFSALRKSVDFIIIYYSCWIRKYCILVLSFSTSDPVRVHRREI